MRRKKSRFSARRLREPRASAAETGRIVEAARLFFESRLSQTEIALKLRVTQGTISRWLRRAEQEGIVAHKVRVPTLAALQAELRRPPAGTFRQIRRCGPQKNWENLGDESARLIVEAILDVQRQKRTEGIAAKVGITLSSGETLQGTCEHLVELLRQSHRRIHADLSFFPAALFWDPEIKAYYPVTLVTTMWTRLHKYFGEHMHAHAPMLPRSYYDQELWRRDDPSKEASRAAALKDSGAEKTLREAGQADIICVGIGTVDDATYPWILKSVRINNVDAVQRDRQSAELIYVPIVDNHGVGERIVRVDRATLRTAAADPTRWVIGIAGGEHKLHAIRQVLEMDPPILNCLVTDATVAENLLRGAPPSAARV